MDAQVTYDAGNMSAYSCDDARGKTTYNNGEGGITHAYDSVFVVIMAFLIIVISLVSVIGNGMVVATIARHRGMRTRTNLLLANLAAADILVGTLDMPFSLIALVKGSWDFGTTFCKFNAFTTGLALMASIHTLMFISINKYISMTRPFSRAMTPFRIKLMACITWLWGIFYNLLPFMDMTTNVYKKGATQCGPIIPCSVSEKIHSGLNTFVNFVLPLTVMTFCNFKIVMEVKAHMKRMLLTSNMEYKKSVLQQKHITMTLVIVTVCFVMCWSPYIIYSSLLVFKNDKTFVAIYWNPIVYWCGYLNSACNPIIYAFRSPSFRQGYMDLLCRGKNVDRLGSFYSGSASGKIKTASQRTYVSQYSRKCLKPGQKKGSNLSRLNMGLHAGKQNEVKVRTSLLPNSGIVSKAVMNHLRHRAQWMSTLKRSPSNPDFSLSMPTAGPTPRRLRRCDTDTCLLPTLATPGLDLFGKKARSASAAIDDASCSFHTLPREREGVGIVIVDANGTSRRLRTESGAFVLSVEDTNPVPVVRVIDVDAISNASLKTLTRSWAEELALTVSAERHRDSVQSLQTWGQSLDLENTVAAVATQNSKRSTHHATLGAPSNLSEVKKCISDPGGLALRRLGSVEHLNRRRLMRPAAATAEAEQPLLRNPDAQAQNRGLLGVAKNGGLRNSIMALFNKASSSYNIAKK